VSDTTLNQIARAFESTGVREHDEERLAPGSTSLLRTVSEFGETNEATLWATALLLTVLQRGGTCLPLSF
jgi:hypothetical protein